MFLRTCQIKSMECIIFGFGKCYGVSYEIIWKWFLNEWISTRALNMIQ